MPNTVSNKNQLHPGAFAFFVVALGATFYFYEYFIRVSPSVMKLQLMQSFDINATLFGTLSAFYFYAYTPMQLVVGILVDRFKLRYLLTLAIVCCAFGSLLMSSTHSYSVATIGRFLQGFGSAFAFVGALRLAANRLPARRFATFTGMCASLGFLGAGFAEIILSEFVEQAGWRSTMRAFVFFGFVLAVLIWFVLKKKPPRNKMVAKAQPSKKLLADNIRHLVEIIKIPRVWFTGIVSSLMFLPTSVFAALWGIPYLEKLHHYNDTTAATATSMIFIGWALGAPIVGWLSDTTGMRMRLIGIGALFSVILVIPLLYSGGLSYMTVCGLFILFGMCSSVQILTFAIARDLSPSAAVGSAVAFVNTLAMLGGMIFQRGIGHMLDLAWNGVTEHGIPIYTLSNYKHAIIIIPVSLAIAMVIALILPDRVTPHHKTDALETAPA